VADVPDAVGIAAAYPGPVTTWTATYSHVAEMAFKRDLDLPLTPADPGAEAALIEPQRAGAGDD
jgi:hypothetical protein